MSLPLYPAHSDLTANLSQNTTSEPTGVGVQRSILAPVLFLETAVGVSGNILVIVTKIKNSKLVRSNFGILMFNLSVSDLGCSLVIMVSTLVSVLAGSWVLGAVVCDLVCLLNYTFIIVSMGTLGAISLDRFVAVVFAVRYRTLFPRSVAVLACVSTWISGLVFGSVPVILRWVSYDGSELVCTIRWNEDFCRVVIYTLCAFAVCFLTPIVIIASSYSLMYRAYRRAASKSNRF
ncbi:G-protein coupled receptor 161-like isoform X2 [Acipenser ruthenus]|uniref:G-protein coupled receptor 161-like isoform X2 n=1 Tax=Acipenser ruthenus TaxID=7906 RepID=UPI002741EA84|nr:G-protein coupled receptor 161-like isoform X2 [Acipenser ruthenus]